MNIKNLWEKYKGIFLYLVFGVLTTAVNIVSYYLCYEVWGILSVSSNIIAWALAVITAFITNKLWVFESKSFAPKVLLLELWRFVSCRLATGVMETVVMWIGVDLLHGPSIICKIGVGVMTVILNYIFSRLIIFKNN